jgi:pimeloyl-ACP methyl ester carboxylesterase
VQLAHDRLGSGPPLLLIHGLGSFRGMWRPVFDRLSAEREVVAIDLPGFGESAPLPVTVRPTVPALTRAVLDFLDGLGLEERPHVAGNSLGGWVALELAKTGRVASATALSPAGFWTRAENRWTDALLSATRVVSELGMRNGTLDALAGSAVGRTLTVGHVFARPWRWDGAEVAAATRALVGAPGFWATKREMNRMRFGGGEAIDVPVTIAWAEHDYILPRRQAARAAAAVPSARWITLAGVGHVPTGDDPALVAETLLQGSAG